MASAHVCAHSYVPPCSLNHTRSSNPAQHTILDRETDRSIDPHSAKAIGRVWQQAHDSTPGRSAGSCWSHRYRPGCELPPRSDGEALSRSQLHPILLIDTSATDGASLSMRKSTRSKSHSQLKQNPLEQQAHSDSQKRFSARTIRHSSSWTLMLSVTTLLPI